ncbi:MAG: adenosylcobinamide-GDP ribazoletransferase [Deferribacteres bacterium]|nr:adenosylcobinamide-GDP ribazoletransferase [Deferribacteres bacterium]
MKRILLSFQFLTIIPVRDLGEVPEEEVGRATAFFPLTGLFEGALLLVLAPVFLGAFPSGLANGLLVLVMVVVNGGLHLDGLADTFDAIASRGGMERKHAIMEESTVGSLGVIAIVMALLLKYLLLDALFFDSGRRLYYSTLLLLPVLSRWTMVPAIYHCRPAKQEGLGKMFAAYTGKKEVLTATLICVAALFMVLGIMSQFSVLTFHLMFIMPVLYMFALAAVWFCNRNFDGMTGDTLGAVHEIAVLIILAIMVIWSQRSA